MAAELDIVEMRLLADAEHSDEHEPCPAFDFTQTAKFKTSS